jgi:predicted dehydrogenase
MRISAVNSKITISIVGGGHRARIYIDALNRTHPNSFVVTHLFDPDPYSVNYFKENYQVENIYNSLDDFLKLDRISDVVIIATLDYQHYLPAKHALQKGYDIILEKPICLTLEETLELKKYKKENQLVAVCHVLRHSLFFMKIKELIQNNIIGKVINIQHNEDIGFYHYAHSYVRGNWRNTNIASPLVVAKSCHDFDILLYLVDKSCLRLASFGSLKHFTKENYDSKTMAPLCSDCPQVETCPYSAVRAYTNEMSKWLNFDRTSKENLIKDLNKRGYGKCVYNCDNNVADHQVTILEFAEGVTATFNLSAFTNDIDRTIKIMGEFGEIRGTFNNPVIEVHLFGKPAYTIKIENPYKSDHNGSDDIIMEHFYDTYINNKPFASSFEQSIESHIMAFKAEESRLNFGKVQEISSLINEDNIH